MQVLRLATTLLTTAVLVIGLGLVALLVVVPRVTGTVPLTVYTGSMEPTIATGAVVLIEPVDPATLRAGDVITYQVAPDVDEYITHRIVTVVPETSPPSFVTKGDANPGADLDPVPVGAVRGKVWIDVPYVGTAQQLVTGRTGIALLAVVAGLVLLGTATARMFRRAPEPGSAAEDATTELPHVGPRS